MLSQELSLTSKLDDRHITEETFLLISVWTAATRSQLLDRDDQKHVLCCVPVVSVKPVCRIPVLCQRGTKLGPPSR